MNRTRNDANEDSIKYEIYICYYFAQIVLYRPFLHYLAKPLGDDAASQRQMAYARTCVRMARKVVEVSTEHQRRGLLCPASWSSVYTVFLSVVCLIFSHATRDQNRSTENLKPEIENGIRLLASTACTTDTGSVRCLEILRRLIKRISYAVDIDLDQICAETKPCCTVDFSPKARTAQLNEIGETHLQDRKSEDTGTSRSGSLWIPSISSQQDARSSVASYNYNYQEPQQLQAYFGASDEILEVPYHEEFRWEGGQERGDVDMEQSPFSEPMQPSLRPGLADQSQRRLTAEDIAAFMHSDQIDQPLLRRPSS